jgi:hypothetical protein
MTQNLVIEEDSARQDDIDRLFDRLELYEPLPSDAFRLNLQVLRAERELPGNIRSLADHKKRRRNMFFPVLAAACTFAFAVLLMGMLIFGGVNDTAVNDNLYAATPALTSVDEKEQELMRLYSRLDMVAEPGYYPTRFELPLNFVRKAPQDAQTSLQFRPW